MRTVLMGLLCGLAATAAADTIYRCTDAAGRVTWTNEACGAEEQRLPVEIRPNVADSQELREWARRNPGPRQSGKAPRQARAPAEEKWIDPVACGNARRAYDFESGYRFQKPAALRARREEVSALCGTDPGGTTEKKRRKRQ